MSPTGSRQSLVVMLGTHERTRGGIAAVVGVLRRHGLFESGRVQYIATHGDGSYARKAAIALLAWLRVAALLLSGRVALLHLHTASGPSFWRKSMFVALARIARVPYVLHVHGGGFERFYRERCGALGRAGVRGVLRAAAALVALSDEGRRVLESIAPLSRCVVIASPVEVPSWSASLDADPPTVLFLGQISEAKGIGDLARAWPQVRRALPRARLVVAGSGEREQALRAQFGRDVHFPGWVAPHSRDVLLRDAWAFVLPSHREALPMSILESMAAGVPVVATCVGGVPQAVRDGETGLLVEPGDADALARALIELLSDASLRLRLGRAARERAVEQFSAASALQRIDALWRETAGTGAQPVEVQPPVRP